MAGRLMLVTIQPDSIESLLGERDARLESPWRTAQTTARSALERDASSDIGPGYLEAGHPTNRNRTEKGLFAMKLPKNLGMILLAVWLIAFGLLTSSILKISFAYSGDILGVLAIAAGILLLLQR